MSSSLQLPPEFRKTLEFQVQMFKIVGLDLFNHDFNTDFIRKYGRLILCKILFFIFTFLQWYYVYAQRDGGKFLETSNAISCAMIFTQDISIFLIITLKKQQILKILADIAEIWPGDDLQIQKKTVFKNWLRRLQTFNKWFPICTASGVVISLCSPLTFMVLGYLLGANTVKYVLPLNMILPLEVNSALRFICVYIYELVTCTTLHCCVNTSYVMLMFALTYNVSTLLRLVQFDLQYCIKPRGYKEEETNQEEAIKMIIETHQKVLRIADKLEETFSLTIFIVMCVTSFIMCFFGFLFVAAHGITAINNFIGLGVIYISILSLVWPGQLLIDTSTGVAEAAYRCLWYEGDVKIRKYILIMITRSQRPAYLSALGFAEIKLSVMFQILNTTWSWINLLNQMYQKNGNV